MRHFGELKGQDLIQLLNTLAGEGVLNTPGVVHRLQATHSLGAQINLYFRDNVFIHATSTDFKFSLSSALGKRGLITKSQLQDLKEVRKTLHPTPSLAQLLLKQQLISETRLKEVINHLNEVVTYEIIMWPMADFKLIPLEKQPDEWSSFFAAELSSEGLLDVKDFALDAEKNMPVLALMREKLSNPNMILRRLREVANEELSELQIHVFQLVNNRNSLREILLLSDLSYFQTYTALFQLLSWEIIATGQLETPRYMKKSPEAPVSTERTTASTPTPSHVDTIPRSESQTAIPDSPPRIFLRRARGADLFQVLSSLIKEGKRSGKLWVENQKSMVHSEMMLHQGNLVHASSTMYSHRFGDLLVKKGLITDEQLQKALATQKQHPGKHLGEILVEAGLIAADTIPKILYHQIECVLYEILSWPDAKFYFEPEAKPLQQKFGIFADYEIIDGRLIRREGSGQPSGRDVLGDADKNLPILLMIKEKMPEPKALVRRTSREPESPLSHEQQQIMALVTGAHSIYDILVLSDLDYFQTYSALFQIFSAGLIELVPETQPTQLPAVLKSASPPAKPETPLRPTVSTDPRSVTTKQSSLVSTPSLASAGTVTIPAEYQQLRQLLGDDLLRALAQISPQQGAALRKALEAIIELAH